MEHRIIRVEEGSIAEKLEVESGDVLLSANGHEVEDVFDWRDVVQSEALTIVVRKKDGEEWELEIEKDPFEDLGLVFENDLMSGYRSCTNKCIFCFIDQMPPGMRSTLYFKDDDSRLSFLQGNYITLTNMKPAEIRRIIHYRLEPMNISIHTTDPGLRVRMLNNRFAGEVLSYLDDFYEAGIRMNGQIVLCKGINDGAQLERTLSDLFRYLPVLESVSVVPVGLTKYREGLYPLEPFGREDAKAVIETVRHWQEKAYRAHGLHFIHASDEFYLLAGEPFPEEETYDGYLQYENGVGMARLLFTEAAEALDALDTAGETETVSYATGLLAAPLLTEILESVERRFPERKGLNRVYGIRNDFFGERITVAGLVTGRDLIAQLKGRTLGSVMYLPGCMFRSGEEVMLDDVTKAEVEQALGVRVRILAGGGDSLVRAMCGLITDEDLDPEHGAYELKNDTGVE